MHLFPRSLRALLLGAFLLSSAHAQISVGDGEYTFNFVVQFWNVPTPEPTPALAATLADLGTAGTAYWFQVNYDIADLLPVTGLDFTPPEPSVQQVITLWDSLLSTASVTYGGPFSGFGYSLNAVSVGGDANSGFGDYYWSLYTGGTGSEANWVSSWDGISSLVASDGLWLGLKYTPSSYSFTDLSFVETAPDVVPEPSSIWLLVVAGIWLLFLRRRQHEAR